MIERYRILILLYYIIKKIAKKSCFDLFDLLYILVPYSFIRISFFMVHSDSIDFYVPIIDNYGDMGFAANLAFSIHEKHPRANIRFFSDDRGLFRKFFGENAPEWIGYIPLGTLNQADPPSPSGLIFNFFDHRIPKEYLTRFPCRKTIVSFSYFLLHEGIGSLHGTTYVLESGYDRVTHFIPSLLPGG